MSGINRTQTGKNVFLQQARQIPCFKKNTSRDLVQMNTENRDQIRISKNEETHSSFLQLLDQLHHQYPDIHIMIEKPAAEDERDILADALGEMGDGYSLILSREFMESLHAGKESYDCKTKALFACMQKLSGLPGATGVWFEEDKAVFWANIPAKEKTGQIMQTQENQGESWISKMLPSPAEQETQKLRLNASSSYQTASSYARMSQAKNKMAVQTVMQQTRRDIVSLKLISVFGDDKEQAKAKAAIRSLQKLLLRGNKKIKKFSEEEMSRRRMKQAAEKKQYEKEIQSRLELKRQKTSRSIFDSILQKEGQLEELNSVPVYRRNRLRIEVPPPPQIAAIDSAKAAVFPDTAAFPAEIRITDIISF